jgi:hypothetical protein
LIASHYTTDRQEQADEGTVAVVLAKKTPDALHKLTLPPEAKKFDGMNDRLDGHNSLGEGRY